MNKRLLSIFLALCMIVTMLPDSVMAQNVHTLISKRGEIVAFAPLKETEKTVATGINTRDLEFPKTLIATVRTAVTQKEESEQDSINPDESELMGDSIDAITGSAIKSEVSQIGESNEGDFLLWEEITMDISVTWISSDYNMETDGEYVFTPVIQGYIVSAELPEIKVIVDHVAAHTVPINNVPQVVGDSFLAPITIGSNTDVIWQFVILTEPDVEKNGTVKIFRFNSGLEQQYTGDLIIPETVTNSGKTYDVTEVSSHTFNSCKMSRVFIPKTIGGSIGSDVFSGSPNLVAFVVDPENTSFCSEDGVLYNKDKTTLVRYPVAKTDTTFTIPSSVNTLSSSAFNGCKNITFIDIPEKVTTMGKSHLFYGCSALTEITIPSGVSYIPFASFMGCTALQTITMKGKVAPVLDLYAFAFSSKDIPINLKIKIPASSTGYLGDGTSDAWKSLADKIELTKVTNFDIWVGGIQVTSGNASDVLGDGKASYIPATDTTPQTLTLTGASITTAYEFDFNPFSKGMAGIYVKGDLNLVLEDNNSIGGSSFNTTGAVSAGIFVREGDLNISGTGSLTAIGGNAYNSSSGVTIGSTGKNLTISGGANLTVIGDQAFYSYGVYVNGSLMVDGGSLTAKGDSSGDSSTSYGAYGAYLNSSFTIKNGGSLTAVGGYAKYNSGGAYFNNTSVSNNIIVEGGNLTASASEASNISIGIKCDTMSISDGTVTASAKIQAMKAALTFGTSFAHKNTAGLFADGSGATVLNDSVLASGIEGYKYVKIEPAPKETTVTNLDLTDKLTAPVMGGLPEKSITNDQYMGTVTWNGTPIKFLGSTSYTALVTLTAKDGYTFSGVEQNTFTYIGATSFTNYAGYGKTLTVTIVFPKTEAKIPQVISYANSSVAKTYGDKNFVNSLTETTVNGKIIYESDDVSVATVNTTTGEVTIVAVGDGSATITATALETGTHAQATSSYTITVAKKTLTLKAEDKNILIGDGLPNFTYTITGLVGSDAVITAPTMSTNTDGATAGTFDITILGGEISNATSYDIAYAKGTLIVADRLFHATVTNGTGSGSYAKGATVAITANDKSGYTFIGWSGLDVTFADVTAKTTTFTMPAKEVMVTANYRENSYDGDSQDDNSPVIITPPALEKPNSPTQGEIKVPGTTDSKGNVTVNITSKTVTKAFNKALADARKNGSEQNGITVLFRVETGSNSISNITINLPKTVQDIIIEKKILNTIVMVDNPDIRIGMDLTAVKEINKQAKSDVTITATRKSNKKLNKDEKKSIGSRPIFDLGVNYGKGKQVQNFGLGRVSVTIPYTLGANEKAGNVQAVYVDAKGKVHWIVNSVYDSVEKVLRFSTDHSSTYGIGYKQINTVFTDITYHWAKESIDFVVSRGLVRGTSDTTFSPNTAMTRGLFVTVLGRLADIDVSVYKNSSFTDVKKDAYSMGYIEWASKNNILTSTVDGVFQPDQPITREQMAVILQNYAKAIGFTLPKVYMENTFADSHKISYYAKDAVKLMQMAGVIRGKTGNYFDPQSIATRGEFSVVLRRFIELMY